MPGRQQAREPRELLCLPLMDSEEKYKGEENSRVQRAQKLLKPSPDTTLQAGALFILMTYAN